MQLLHKLKCEEPDGSPQCILGTWVVHAWSLLGRLPARDKRRAQGKPSSSEEGLGGSVRPAHPPRNGSCTPGDGLREWGLSQGCRGSWGEAASTATGCGRWCWAAGPLGRWAAGRGRVAGSRGAGPVREEGQEAAKAPERQQLIPRQPMLLPRVHRRPPAGGTLLQDPLPAPTSLLTALSSQLRGPHPEPDPHPPPLSASVGSTGATRGASAGLLRATCSAAFEARPALERAQGRGGGGPLNQGPGRMEPSLGPTKARPLPPRAPPSYPHPGSQCCRPSLCLRCRRCHPTAWSAR